MPDGTSDDHAQRLAEAIKAVLREQMDASPATRSLLVALAKWVLAELDRSEPDAPPEPLHPKKTEHTTPPSSPENRGVVPLRIGDGVLEIEVPGSVADLASAHVAAQDEEPEPDTITGRDVDLDLVVRRCRLKAESCRVYIDRRAAEYDEQREPEVIERMNALLTQGKGLENCFLWVFWRQQIQPEDDTLRTIAACYEALADAAELCALAVSDDGLFTQDETRLAFQMLAEADSALRVALTRTWLTKPDRDQEEVHLWLRENTYYREIFVPRYMRIDDPADPARAGLLREETRALADTITNRKNAAKKVDSILNRIRYHAKRLDEQGRLETHDARKINESFEQLAELDVQPGDPRLEPLCDLVSIELFPDEQPASQTLQRFAEHCTPEPAGDESSAPPAPPTPVEPRWSDRVLEVRELLRGGRVVLIGGEKRPDAADRIISAFELDALDWVSITEHASSEPMRAPIFRDDTRLVIVLVKLSGHQHIDDATRYAREADLPLVRMPAGYNPEQIAEQVLTQAGDRLAAAGS